MKLTGTFVIEAGVLNRNESLTNVLSLKEIYTPKGLKVFFSDKAYKASLFSQGKFETTVSRAGGVVQKIGTVIENEELDFAGTMIAGKGDLDKVAYKRETAFAVSYGETIYPADTTIEFLTNGRLSELYGLNKTNPFSRKTVKNIYKLSFVIDLDRVGEQSFSIVKTSEMEDIEDIDKAEFLHKYFLMPLQSPVDLDKFKKLINERVLNLSLNEVTTLEANNPDDEKPKKRNSNSQATKYIRVDISLKPEVKYQRVKKLINTMFELERRIEGRSEPLYPSFSVWSFNLNAPIFHNFIDDIVSIKDSKLYYNDLLIRNNEPEAIYGALSESAEIRSKILDKVRGYYVKA